MKARRDHAKVSVCPLERKEDIHLMVMTMGRQESNFRYMILRDLTYMAVGHGFEIRIQMLASNRKYLDIRSDMGDPKGLASLQPNRP